LPATLKGLKNGVRGWQDHEFFGYTGRDSAAFNCHQQGNGIVVAFSAEKWRARGDLIDKLVGFKGAA
jgi:hypothetical protein